MPKYNNKPTNKDIMHKSTDTQKQTRYEWIQTLIVKDAQMSQYS